MKILYYDCFAGISGDMNLGAMIDLGVDPEYIRSELAKLNIDGFRLEVSSDARRGITGTKATVIIENPENEKHRHLRHIEELINGSTLSKNVKETSLKIFQHIAQSEATVHGIDIQKVHFHEVGALDSIADIVGAAVCLDYLNVGKILSSPVQLGGGTVKCAHGVMPVPAPATALIVKNIPVRTGLVQHEATTPTGAAILAAIVDEFTAEMSFEISKTAYGIGQRDVSDVPNVLRVYLSETAETFTDVDEQKAFVVECNIDDMNPEHYTFLSEKLFTIGADDVWFTPIVMKKSRPAITVSVLCSQNILQKIKAALFENTTSLGLREYSVLKSMLVRDEKIVETQYGNVRVKVSYFNGRQVNAKPEYADCEKLASQHGVSLAEIEKKVIKLL